MFSIAATGPIITMAARGDGEALSKNPWKPVNQIEVCWYTSHWTLTFKAEQPVASLVEIMSEELATSLAETEMEKDHAFALNLACASGEVIRNCY